MEDIKELQYLHTRAEQIALTLEQCNTTEEVISTLRELKYKHFTWQADTCYVDGEKKPLGGACKLIEYWQRDYVDELIEVNHKDGVVVARCVSEPYLSSIAPLSKRIRTLIGRY